MTITVHIPETIEMQMREQALLHHMDAVRDLFWKAVKPTIEMFIKSTTPSKISDNEFESLADQLADEFTTYIDPNSVPLSDYAVSREGIYADHL